MLSILNDYLECLETLHAGINQTLAGLSLEALDWSPGPDMNSLGVLAAHVAGSERYWVGEVAGGDPAGRERSSEFRTRQLEAALLVERLEASLAHSQATLEKLTITELEKSHPVISEGQTKMVTGAWAIYHALEHTAIHLGQMQLTRQLWEQR